MRTRNTKKPQIPAVPVGCCGIYIDDVIKKTCRGDFEKIIRL